MNNLQEWIDSHDIDVNNSDNLMCWIEQTIQEQSHLIDDFEKATNVYKIGMIEFHAKMRYLELALEKAPT
jgi:hypothetical protein